MDFNEFKKKYLKANVEEYPNNRKGKTPLLTIKVVTYNHVAFIEKCIDAILMQITDFDFEILIAEDGSNDGTREICIEYAKKYPDKIRLLLNSRENNISINGRPTGTFNSAYANFTINSKYISIIEGDDYWIDKYYLQKGIDFLENNEDHVFCFHNAKAFQQNLNKFDEKLLVPFNKSVSLDKESILSTHIPTLTLIYRTGLFEVFDENMIQIIFGDLILRGKLLNFGKARYIHEVEPSVYRIHNDGIHSGSSFKDNKNATLQAGAYLLNFYKKINWDANPVNESLARFFLHSFFYQIKREKKIIFYDLINCLKYSRKTKISFLTIFTDLVINKKNYT